MSTLLFFTPTGNRTLQNIGPLDLEIFRGRHENRSNSRGPEYNTSAGTRKTVDVEHSVCKNTQKQLPNGTEYTSRVNSVGFGARRCMARTDRQE